MDKLDILWIKRAGKVAKKGKNRIIRIVLGASMVATLGSAAAASQIRRKA